MNTTRSKQLYERAQAFIPGGVNSPARAWSAVGGDPLFVARGSGSHIWDVDGNEFIDYVCSWGPLVLGHAHQEVVTAVIDAAHRGTSYGAPTGAEVTLAEIVVDALPSLDMVRFVNSGTEATMSALRLARAYTGRSKILKFEGGYHGHNDALLVEAGSSLASHGVPTSAGINEGLAADTVVAPYNDAGAISAAFHANPRQIAAVIVEPIAANMGVVPPGDGWLQGVRDATAADGALLIFDEVISGFRVGWGGAQSLYGITPDLTCLGKIVGGGLPVGAYGGRGEIMEQIAPIGPMFQAGTLSGNPLAMVAGTVTLERLRESNAYDRLEHLGARLAAGLEEAFRTADVPVVINRVGSILTVFFTGEPVTNMQTAAAADHAAFGRWFHALLNKGVYTPPSGYEAWFVSLAHTDSDIDATVEAAAHALDA